MNDSARLLDGLLDEYKSLAEKQRQLIDSEDYDALNASFESAMELEERIKNALDGSEPSPALREKLSGLQAIVSENIETLSVSMKKLGKSNARRADIRRGLAGYDPMPYQASDVIDIKM
ncbi:MAG: hypothetical protein LBH17_06505 [Oscillospiraceae bacterium]|jgi:hypothetical protein|nr:hypothetical protein [Oscillospiraceae bacterium]